MKFAENLLHQPIQCRGPVKNQACVPGGWPHIFLRHGANGGGVLRCDGFRRASAFADIAGQPAREANVIRRIHVDCKIVEGEKAVVVEGEDAVHYQHAAGLNPLRCARDAGVSCKIIERAIDGPPFCQIRDVSCEEVGFEHPGIVKVLLTALLRGEMRQIAIVVVQRKVCAGKHAGEFSSNQCLTGAGTSANADDYRRGMRMHRARG